MKEIEIKAKIDNREMILKKLEDMGAVFPEPVFQHDLIFLPNGVSFSEINDKINVLRIRKQNDRILFNLKRRAEKEIELGKIEIELEISDAQKMENIISNLGYYKVVEVKKERRKSKYENYEICIDSVEGLGDFIEVEKMSDEDTSAVQKEMAGFLKSLGISAENRVYQGYDTQIINKTD